MQILKNILKLFCLVLITSQVSALCPSGYTGDNCEIECGLSYFSSNQKIVGGVTAVANSWPSTAYVLFSYGDNVYLPEYGRTVFISRNYVCGGTLIDKTTIVTAAHCIYTSISFTYGITNYKLQVKPNSFYPTIASMYKVYLGLQDASSISSRQLKSPAVQMNVANVIVHESYSSTTLYNDIALLKLSSSAPLNIYIQPACLPSQSTSYPSTSYSSWAVGWGAVSSTSTTASSTLRNVKLTLYDGRIYCSVYNFFTTQTQICAGSLLGGRGVCGGDDGGPLYVKETLAGKSRNILAGATSNRASCGQSGYPSIFTRISSFIDWIEKNKRTSGTTLNPTVSTIGSTTSRPSSNSTTSRPSSNSTTSRPSSSSTILRPSSSSTTSRPSSSSSISSSTSKPSSGCPLGFLGDNCEIECGLTFFEQNQKIVGGTVAVSHSWPSQAYVTICKGSSCYLCGGTLIDRTTVLTAAHCIEGPTYTYTVYLGIQDTNTIRTGNISPGVKMVASRVTPHENYDSDTTMNDIAILKFSTPVTLSNFIQPACLPTSQSATFPSANSPAWVVGWGTTSSGGSTSNLLKNVKITTYDGTQFCKDYYPVNWGQQICAGDYYNGGKDTCQGDSGGPLYILNTLNGKNKYILAGITSYGIGCGDKGVPGIYTKVSAYLDWINKNR
jgi:secreted trypsin-like serine protease